MDYITFLENTANRLDEIDEQYERVRDMYALMEECGLNVSDQEMAEYRSTRPSLERMINA